MLDLVLMAVGVANYYEIDTDIFTRLVYAESRFDPAAVSPTGCVGLCQINLNAWPLDKWVANTEWDMNVTDPHDPLANLLQGAHILKAMMTRFEYKGAAVAAYTLGEGRAAQMFANHESPSDAVYDYIYFVSEGIKSSRWGTWSWREAVERGEQ